MPVLVTLVLFAVALTVARPSLKRLVSFIWQDFARTLCCALVALAITAITLNNFGLHPAAMPGSLFMGLVGCTAGALLLRWGETHHK